MDLSTIPIVFTVLIVFAFLFWPQLEPDQGGQTVLLVQALVAILAIAGIWLTYAVYA